MTKSKREQTIKTIIVITALIVGFLMPYVSRIPLAFKYGTPCFWRYIQTTGDFMRWNGFHLASLIPVIVFGIMNIFENIKWAFFAAALGQCIVTFLIYYEFGDPNFGVDDFLGCILFPPVIAGISFICGVVAVFAEFFFRRRKSAGQIKTF